MKKKLNTKNQVIVYQAKNGGIELKGDITNETIWATQDDIRNIFEISQSVISRHIKNIFKSEELGLSRNMQKMHIPNSDKSVTFYSLDVILAVGYRTNTKNAINFRRWANKIIKGYLTQGFVINRAMLAKNYDSFMKTIEDIKLVLPSESSMKNYEVLELVKLFANTWFSLDAFDKSELPETGATKKQVDITSNELNNAIKQLKSELIEKGQASELFANEKSENSLGSIVANVFQSFGGKDLYPSVELKAANLLYFIIKNHPFTDGNKRSAAFAFIWYLNKSKVLDRSKITPEALTALTILIAESKMNEKEKMIGIVLLLLKKNV